MGNVTVSIKRRYIIGSGKAVVADVTGSSSYATGGDSYTNAQFEIGGVGPANLNADAIIDSGVPGYVIVPDIPNKKLKYFKGAAGLLVEETAATNLSAVTGRVVVMSDNPNI